MRTTPSPRLIGFKNSGTTPDFGVAVRALSFSMHIYTVNDNERPVSIAYFYTSKNFFHSPEIKIRHSYYQFKPIFNTARFIHNVHYLLFLWSN